MNAPESAPRAVIAPGVASSPPSLSSRVQAFRERHARAEIALFFSAGFIFDVVTLDRIDNLSTLLMQGGYLAVLGGLLTFEQWIRLTRTEAPRGLRLLWRFHEPAAHFFLGSLLSAFALFFFKSASSLSAFAFLAVMFGLLVVNELPRFQRLGPVVRFGLYSLCLTAYFGYLFPVLAGRLGAWLFVLAAVVALVPLCGLYLLALRWSGSRRVALRQVAAPAVAMQVALVSLYFVGAIPPVPLSLQYIGIFHDVKKDEAGYQLFHERERLRFWERGDQLFRHRPGDKVFVFASVFAPVSVQKGNLPIHFHWFHQHPEKGWQPQGSWTYGGMVGGRAEGFRVFATRTDPRPGKWRVELRAPDGREIGSIRFEVVPDTREGERTYQVQPG
jgi:hypothetical protein